MTDEEKAKFKSVIVRYIVPMVYAIDAIFLGVSIYGSFVGYSQTLMIILTTCAFIGYHTSYRILVGRYVGKTRPILNLNSKLFRVDLAEASIYEALGVKDWKDKMPAWNKTHFMLSMKDARDINKISKVMRYNISAEITHHISFYLSLFGTLFCLMKGMQQWWWSFGAVSLILGLVGDLPFIVIQRYNRARLYQIYDRLVQKASKEEIKTK